jgi:hypothetical protein
MKSFKPRRRVYGAVAARSESISHLAFQTALRITPAPHPPPHPLDRPPISTRSHSPPPPSHRLPPFGSTRLPKTSITPAPKFRSALQSVSPTFLLCSPPPSTPTLRRFSFPSSYIFYSSRPMAREAMNFARKMTNERAARSRREAAGYNDRK